MTACSSHHCLIMLAREAYVCGIFQSTEFQHRALYTEVISLLPIQAHKEDHPISFCARVYYFQNGRASFVVTKNLPEHITVSVFEMQTVLHAGWILQQTLSLSLLQAVMKTYDSASIKDEFPLKIDRHSPVIGLEFTSDSGWKITPRVTPAQVCIIAHY